MHIYSPFFQTLYDEQEPVGTLGRGTHYSVLRAIVFHDEKGQSFPSTHYRNAEARYHDFAIIWDEDHDTRVIEAIQKIYAEGLLPFFSFLSERKGGLTALANSDSDLLHHFAATRIQDICSDIYNDCWTTEVGSILQPQGIISSDTESVVLYLKNINMLWKLGSKSITYDQPSEEGPLAGSLVSNL